MDPVRRPAVPSKSLVGALLFLVAIGAGCAESDDGPTSIDPGYVGTVDGTDAFVGVVAGSVEAVVYVCNGDEQLSAWFAGPIDDTGAFDLANGGGDTVAGTIGADTVTGTFTPAGGAAHPFVATPAAAGGGVFRAMGDDAEELGIWAGWILDGTGGERGALTRNSTFQPTPRFDPTGLRVDGRTIPIVQFIPPQTPATPPGVPIPYPITGGTTAAPR